jgi:multimeric flavodoxin WrbA/putative sterol carrier protein
MKKPLIVAVNGSPHGAIGNTSRLIEMLRETLADEGFELEEIRLAGKQIAYCIGCGFCMEKGRCWIDDDHREITEKLLSADGIVLASPVYFLHVTAQMKTFIDRSLGFGHKPRTTWKPGLAVSISAGLGESGVAEYLGFILRTFGAFSVGTLTALAIAPGQFLGLEAVQARAGDLARDLARAIREKRRYPATEKDLRYYQFMGDLVRSVGDSVMKDDFAHWQKHGLYAGFEAYVKQTWAPPYDDGGARESWIQEKIAEQKARKREEGKRAKKKTAPGATVGSTCQELFRKMPQAFNPEAAGGLSAVYQFEVTGSEAFVTHLRIADGKCAVLEGPADRADVIIKTPADVWLAISHGELDGQQAFMDGKYTAVGDLALLMKLRTLFSRGS